MLVGFKLGPYSTSKVDLDHNGTAPLGVQCFSSKRKFARYELKQYMQLLAQGNYFCNSTND